MRGARPLVPLAFAVCSVALVALTARPGALVRSSSIVAARDPSWAPDGLRVACSVRDQLWTLGTDGRDPRLVTRWPKRGEAIERDPAFSPDGRTLAFAARVEAGAGFDLYVVEARGGAPRRVSSSPGDERWPSWMPDGRLVFAAHDRGQWDLFVTGRSAGSAPERLTDTAADETEPQVSPDGRAVVFVSTRDAPDGESDLWLLELAGRVEMTPDGPRRPEPAPLRRDKGAEWAPAWSPDGRRLAYGVTGDGGGSIRILAVDLPDVAAGGPGPPVAPVVRPPIVVSERPGEAAWSPDGRTLFVADLAVRDEGYNGQPRRSPYGASGGFPVQTDLGARFLQAPAPPDAGTRPLRAVLPATSGRRLALFDEVWTAMARRYRAGGPGAAAWQGLRTRYRPVAAAAPDDAALEDVIDALLADQPVIGPAVTGPAGVVVTAHPLASEAGARALRAGGNAVDAAIASSFALGVVEPDASGIGGDGMALVWPAGAGAPVVVDFKDQAPAAASLDNPAILRGGRIVEHGPAAINVPGVVAGMDHLHRRFGSGRVGWAELLAPAIEHAAHGVVLDGALPATIAEGQTLLARYDATRRLFLPGGRPLQPGDRLVNTDYSATLRTLAAEGADAFYRGALARRIVDDLARHGGILQLEDLEQYRVVERAPVRGTYRGHVLFSTPPPVASGTTLVEVLQTLDRQPLAPGTRLARDVDAAHVLIETLRQTHLVRAADPALWADMSAVHLDPAHAREIHAGIDPQRASRRRPAAAEPDEPVPGSSGAGADAAGDDDGGRTRLGRGTSALVAIDRDGTVVVVTQTLSTWGGAFYVSEGLGFLYNNHLRMARTRRGVPGQLMPRARSSSANASTIVAHERDGRLVPRLALGAAGSAWIVPSVAGVVSAVIDGGLGAQAAVEAPRLRVDESGDVQIEDRFPRRLVAELTRRGHTVARIGGKGELRFGFVSALAIDPATGLRSAGADPRRSHAAVAVP